MARTKTLGANLPVPQNRDDAAGTVREIGELNRAHTRLEADMNDRIAAIKQDYEGQAEPLKQAIAAKTEGLKIWAEANRAVLTGGDRTKTVDLGTGICKWRIRPPSVRLSKIEEIIQRLKARGLKRFLRVKEEIDKEALLREPAVAATIAGVSIGSQGEDFIVEPFEAELSAATAA